MQWFKKIFAKKKSFDEVVSWLSEEKAAKEKELLDIVLRLEESLPDIQAGLQKSLSDLENAELHNPNIPERAKHFMIGNREHFLRVTKQFSSSLFVPKTEEDFNELQRLFRQFAEQNARPSAILSEFFGDNLREIKLILAGFESETNTISSAQRKVGNFKEIKKFIENVNVAVENRRSAEKEFAELNEKLRQLHQSQEQIQKEKQAITARSEYAAVKDELVTAANDRRVAAQAISGLFSPLSSVFKKYAHKTNDALISEYGEDAISALVNDFSFKIIKQAEKVRHAILQQEIDVKREEFDKLFAKLNELTKENLGPLVHKYANAKKLEADVHKNIAERDVIKAFEQKVHESKQIAEEIELLEKRIANFVIPVEDDQLAELRFALKEQGIVLVEK
ncbi:hypothetical protein COV18_00415 [Candidatus Woesearchaeota archaeon CG10_big_fil_rev_8_21_14_0_10_37_12]|nr:MAG: hypothetical protein COV18_00415 [Candidatus Woesearchaeota archaeon CG10_big_fil_rev_8_21_14_0_10_37_12]